MILALFLRWPKFQRLIVDPFRSACLHGECMTTKIKTTRKNNLSVIFSFLLSSHRFIRLSLVKMSIKPWLTAHRTKTIFFEQKHVWLRVSFTPLKLRKNIDTFHASRIIHKISLRSCKNWVILFSRKEMREYNSHARCACLRFLPLSEPVWVLVSGQVLHVREH